MVNPHGIKRLLADDDFKAFVAATQDQLSRKVMAPATTKADRKKALAESHGLASFINRMTSAAQNAKDDEQ